MTDQLQHQFLWLDFETTGLLDSSPGGLFSGTAALLEFALLLVRDHPDEPPETFCEEVQSFTAPIAFDSQAVQMSEYVRGMHTRSGLLDDCMTANAITLEGADAFLFEACQAVTGLRQPKWLVLAGNSVHFDRMWVRAMMPKFDSCLSHQVFDVSGTLSAFAKRYRRDRPELVAQLEAKTEPKHRAIDDIRWSVETFRRIELGTR